MPISIDFKLTEYQSSLQLKQEGGKRYIYDPIRKKYLVFGPEELVRQLLIQYLIQDVGIKQNRIAVERMIKVNELTRRVDILIYDAQAEPWLLIETKAPKVKITDDTFKQAAWYNMTLKVPYLMVSNGLENYICAIDFDEGDYRFLEEVPS